MFQQRGVAGVLIVVGIMIVGIAVGIYLVSQRTNFLPKASSGSTETSVNLSTYPPSQTAGVIQVLPENKFSIDLTVRSNLEPIKQINIKLRFPANLFTLDTVDASSFGVLPVEWQVRDFDNQQGTATFIANIPGEGFQNSNTEPSLIARLNFSAKPLTAGNTGKIEFLEQGTSFTSTSGPINSLIQRSLEIQIGLAAR